jgi:hypothetical protein
MSNHSTGIPAAFFVMIFSLTLAGPAFAGMSCADLHTRNPRYQDNMDAMARQAGLPDGYWSKYHASVVGALCSGNTREVDSLVDNGYVKPQEAQNIARVMGMAYTPKKRSDTGKSYGYSKNKFIEMGACNACADNIAQYYTKKPDSRCGKLAKQALEGNPDAIRLLVSFPDYCQWKY